MFQGETKNMANKNGFVDELQAQLPGLSGTQALGWASAAVKHLAQYLDASGREELAKYLPPSLVPVAEEAAKVVELFGNEKPGDFFLMATIDAGAPPSKAGARRTLATVLATIRKHIPDRPAAEIEKALPGEIAELWGAEALAA